jgi:choline monooxygenase
MNTVAIDSKRISANLDRPAADAVGLPATMYTDAGVLAVEQKKLFEDGWVSVLAAGQLPKPGDVRPVTVAGRPLLVVRDRENQIRVFHNVCRHRGLKLVTEAGHTPGVITCAYHCWSYGLDGSLKGTPYLDGTAKSTPPESLRSRFGLLPVRSAVWLDTVFVNISGDAQPFEEFIKPLAERWSGFDLSQLRLADSTEFKVASNWKFAAENLLDLYHLPWVHAQLGGPEAVFQSEPAHLAPDIFGYMMPTFDAARAETGPTMTLFSPLPKRFEYALDLIMIFPNTGLLLTPSWAQVMILHGDTPSTTRQILNAYVVGDELFSAETEEARKGFVGYLHEVNVQDLSILARLQESREGGDSTDAGKFAPQWDDLALRFYKRVARAY